MSHLQENFEFGVENTRHIIIPLICNLPVTRFNRPTCLDSELYLRLTSSIAATTPVLGVGASCLTMLVNIFRQKYPMLLRRRTFFSMKQQSGQDERAFLESIKAAAGEADIQGITLEDALCLVCLTGLKDNWLREKLSELKTPTLPAFAVLIDAYMHSKATAGSSAAAAAAVGRQQNKVGNKNKNNNTGNRPGLSENEKKRRSVMKGKCYRCGSPDHMANNCSVAKDIKCKRCNGTGHTQAACVVSGQARATDDRSTQNSQNNASLALEYQPESMAPAN